MKIEQIRAVNTANTKLKRTAAYARVSVDKEPTQRSLSAQVSYYNQLIANNPEWLFAGIYADEGISGTKTNRPEFMRMMEDARAHKLDLIITKSVTRFARNTVALLTSIRELKECGVDVYFEKEDIHSISPDGELLLTLLAMYAEEEARSISENIRWGYEKRFERGEYFYRATYGYQRGETGYVIQPEEAEIVKRIYREYLDGASEYSITKRLNAEGITRSDGRRWNTVAIRNILTNEKYIGNILLQKTFVEDFRTKKVVINKGEKRKYLIVGAHEAIISEEVFDKAQEERRRREEERPKHQKNNPDNLFKGKVVCSECGLKYKRVAPGPKYKKLPYYTCYCAKNFRQEKCSSHIIKEETLVIKTMEVLGISESDVLDRDTVERRIDKIVCTPDFKLLYYLNDGRTETKDWQDCFYGTPRRRQKSREQLAKNLAQMKTEREEVSPWQ